MECRDDMLALGEEVNKMRYLDESWTYMLCNSFDKITKETYVSEFGEITITEKDDVIVIKIGDMYTISMDVKINSSMYIMMRLEHVKTILTYKVIERVIDVLRKREVRFLGNVLEEIGYCNFEEVEELKLDIVMYLPLIEAGFMDDDEVKDVLNDNWDFENKIKLIKTSYHAGRQDCLKTYFKELQNNQEILDIVMRFNEMKEYDIQLFINDIMKEKPFQRDWEL